MMGKWDENNRDFIDESTSNEPFYDRTEEYSPRMAKLYRPIRKRKFTRESLESISSVCGYKMQDIECLAM